MIKINQNRKMKALNQQDIAIIMNAFINNNYNFESTASALEDTYTVKHLLKVCKLAGWTVKITTEVIDGKKLIKYEIICTNMN